MKSVMQDIQSELRRFIDSQTESLLVVSCEPDHSGLLLKSLESLDDDPKSLDVFLTFGHPFTNSRQYVRKIPPNISQQLAGVNRELAKRGEPALPALPAEIENESQKPLVRLVGLMRYAEGLVTYERRVIWVLYPMEIGATTPYAQLVSHVNDELKNGSLRITKLIVRDSAISPVLERGLDGQPNVKMYRPELGPESLEKKLNEKANDPALPMEEQAQLQMTLAGFDVANQRYDVALSRNLELLGYFKRAGQRHQQSVVMNNIGDLHYIQGRFEEAQAWYERALKLSVDLESKPLALYQSLNLGNALLAQNRFTDALVYYDGMERLSRVSSLPIQQVEALEQVTTPPAKAGGFFRKTCFNSGFLRNA
jgi:tetratricopeptide (TPR) repeat protein